jgi:hypothetical protein
MNKNALFALATAALFSGCASGPRIGEGRSGSLSLPGLEPRKGGHCESSALLNALSYLGYGLAEPDIVGGSIGFACLAGPFPFIGGRSQNLREEGLGAAAVPFRVGRPGGGASDWEPIFALLERGLPVALRVDMRWLPYLYGGRYGSAYMSFGGHWICLVGVDFDEAEALVTDTGYESAQRVSLADLGKARFSKTKTFPPLGEYAWIESRPAGWSFDRDRAARAALDTALAGYGEGGGAVAGEAGKDEAGAPAGEGGLFGLPGLAAFPAFLASFREGRNPYALAPAYSYMAGSIERNGTGGAAFRRFFRDFLAARAADCADPELRAACAALVPRAEAAMSAWSALAAAFDEAASRLGAAKGPARAASISEAEAATAERARALYAAEGALRDAIAAALADLAR